MFFCIICRFFNRKCQKFSLFYLETKRFIRPHLVGNLCLRTIRSLSGSRHVLTGQIDSGAKGNHVKISRVMLFVAGMLVFSCSPIQAGSALLQIQTRNENYLGKEIVHNDDYCWLLERDGKIKSFPFSSVTGFKRVSSHFKPYSATEMRTQLRLELGQDFEIIGTTHYLICAAAGHGKKYGKLFEQLYREMHVYFSTRGFAVQRLEFPLVAIIFPEHEQFVKYARKDGIANTRGLAGYYQRETNRIALYDPAMTRKRAAVELPGSFSNSTFARTSVSDSLQSTIIHEATHQVAFNLGLHSRLGETPRWVVEGLATVFEHPETRSASKSGSASSRINRERFIWFGNYAKQRRKKNSLKNFIASDRPFQTGILDAYSQSWALSFFLMETRPSEYARYLKRVSSRPLLEKYTSKERVDDFHFCFGTRNKMELFEAEFLRFIQRLK